ncbi:hypothetical protein [Treponema sp. R6D11]
MPDTAQEKTQQGTVTAVGPGPEKKKKKGKKSDKGKDDK